MFLSFLAHLIIGQDSTFETKPLNTHFVVIGGDSQNPSFNCSINYRSPLDTTTIWVEYVTNSGGTQISNNEFVENPSKYETEGEYNLIIRNPRLSEAGKYECQNSLSGPGLIQSGAELIVLGKLS